MGSVMDQRGGAGWRHARVALAQHVNHHRSETLWKTRDEVGICVCVESGCRYFLDVSTYVEEDVLAELCQAAKIAVGELSFEGTVRKRALIKVAFPGQKATQRQCLV